MKHGRKRNVPVAVVDVGMAAVVAAAVVVVIAVAEVAVAAAAVTVVTAAVVAIAVIAGNRFCLSFFAPFVVRTGLCLEIESQPILEALPPDLPLKFAPARSADIFTAPNYFPSVRNFLIVVSCPFGARDRLRSTILVRFAFRREIPLH